MRRSMSLWKNYHLPQNVNEAVEMLAGLPGTGRIVSGGTDLLLDLQQGRHPPVDWLLDVTAIPELNRLELCDGELFVGAATPLSQIVVSPLVKEHAWALYEACQLIGGPQVRNVATLGGNVGHALPAGDGTIALLALDALAEVADNGGRQRLPLESLFLGPGRSGLHQGQLLVGFHLSLRGSHEGSAFRRVMRPQGVAIAILNMAAWARLEGETLEDVRLAIGPAGPIPFRARAAEQALRGRRFTTDSLEAARLALLAGARFRTSPHRASSDYRQHLAGELLQETLEAAVKIAQNMER
jgi:xanthine dehydrogenase FAD-binding subunit